MKITSLERAASGSSVVNSMPPRRAASRNQLVQEWFVDGRLDRVASLAILASIGIDAGDVVSQISQAGPRYASYVSRSNYCYSHDCETGKTASSV